MRPERSNDVSTVPDGGMSVKHLIAQAVAGAPMRLCAVGVDVSKDATVSDKARVCAALYQVSVSANMHLYFTSGDVYVSTAPYSAERSALEDALGRSCGSSFVRRIREFGKIARRWPKDRRDETKPWQYYRSHRPGVLGKPDVKVDKPPVVIRAGKSVEYEAGPAREGFDANGKRYLIIEVKP